MYGAAVLRSRRPRSDEGFTLVELVLTVALMGIVGGAIASSLLVLLSTKQRTQGALAVSQDRQFVSNYFSDDVAGAVTVTEGSQPVCGTTQSTVVLFSGKDVTPGTTSSVATTVAWSYVPVSKTLTRTACSAGSPMQVRTVARNVASAPTASASCTASVALSSTPKPIQVGLTVPQVAGNPLTLCASRRPE